MQRISLIQNFEVVNILILLLTKVLGVILFFQFNYLIHLKECEFLIYNVNYASQIELAHPSGMNNSSA